MLKSQVPVYFCSIASAVVLLSAASPRYTTPLEPGKVVFYTVSTTDPLASKKAKIVLPLHNKQGMKFVHNYIKNNDECLLDVRQRSEIPFTIIDSVFNHYGLPLELKYLAVIESELKSSAVSRVGAKGPWQLMPATARILGLKVNRRTDDRMNYYKSTKAAARYLRDLHKKFGDWLLVLAAYNGGPGPVTKAIHKSHSRNFWALQRYLPAESREHVKKFIATAYYFEKMDSINDSTKSKEAVVHEYAETKPKEVQEPANEKFNRLMKESAHSLKISNELIETAN
jgi:membrane-bound lytic murein transglycosylase D